MKTNVTITSFRESCATDSSQFVSLSGESRPEVGGYPFPEYGRSRAGGHASDQKCRAEMAYAVSPSGKPDPDACLFPSLP